MNAAAADQMLRDAWRHQVQIPALPLSCRPLSREEGYAVQARVEHMTSAPLFGWKIAATSQAGQAHVGVAGPMAGRLLRERVLTPEQPVSLHSNLMSVAEPEFAFLMGRDLPPTAQAHGVDAVMAAVQGLHLAIEIPDSRFLSFEQAGEAQLIADNACAHEFVLGPEVTADWRRVDLSRHVVTAEVHGKARTFRREGVGANVLGDPRWALTWLANELSSLGITLRAGQVVTTGTCMVPLEVQPGDRVSVDYGELGTMAVRFV